MSSLGGFTLPVYKQPSYNLPLAIKLSLTRSHEGNHINENKSMAGETNKRSTDTKYIIPKVMRFRPRDFPLYSHQKNLADGKHCNRLANPNGGWNWGEDEMRINVQLSAGQGSGSRHRGRNAAVGSGGRLISSAFVLWKQVWTSVAWIMP